MNNQYNAIEIGYEPNAHGLRLRGEHRILDRGWADYLNRELDRDDLFSYYHILTKNFVLCQWLDKDQRICKELETSPKKFENGGWESLDYMRARLRPQEEVFEELQEKMKARQLDEGSKAPNKAGEITESLVDLAKNHSTDRKYFS